MKRIYWRPQRVSLRVLLLILVTALAGFISVEKFKITRRQLHYQEKMKAAQQAKYAFDILKEERLRRGFEIDSDSDPTESGLIGLLSSPVTTDTGYLPAKRTSVNPNFAAVVVSYLKNLGIGKDDLVAVGLSGSFPAINICVYSAIETLGAEPVVISSSGSSQWGANIPGFLWPDMENFLNDKKVFKARAMAVSLGGIDDRALGLSSDGKKTLEDSILCNGYTFLKVKNYMDSVDSKLKIFMEKAGDRPIKAYINIGGGTTSVGTKIGKLKFKPGINTKVPVGGSGIDSVMTRFIFEGVPVIHMTKVEKIAQKYGFPLQPKTTPLPGKGTIFTSKEYNKWLIAVVLAVIFGAIFVLARLDWGFRLLADSQHKNHQPAPPEPMI